MSKESPNFVRDYMARFPLNKARLNVYQNINYWRHVKKKLPPDDLLAVLEVTLKCNPPDGKVQHAMDSWRDALVQLDEWRDERAVLEDELARWAAMTPPEGGPDA